jgi:hypothetical protein
MVASVIPFKDKKVLYLEEALLRIHQMGLIIQMYQGIIQELENGRAVMIMNPEDITKVLSDTNKFSQLLIREGYDKRLQEEANKGGHDHG